MTGFHTTDGHFIGWFFNI